MCVLMPSTLAARMEKKRIPRVQHRRSDELWVSKIAHFS
jgi:hypothetical protein